MDKLILGAPQGLRPTVTVGGMMTTLTTWGRRRRRPPPAAPSALAQAEASEGAADHHLSPVESDFTRDAQDALAELDAHASSSGGGDGSSLGEMPFRGTALAGRRRL